MLDLYSLRDFGVAFLIIISSLIYYKLVSGFMSDVTIRRLTKTSFDTSIEGFLDLFFAYLIGVLAYIVIYFFKLSSDGPYEINPMIFISSGFGLLYLGRVLTKQQGSIFGKLHFSSLFIVVFIIILIQILSLIDTDKPIFEIVYGTSMEYMNFFENNKIFILICAVFLSSLGEVALSLFPPAPKSLLAVADKFPSDFRVICGLHPKVDGSISISQVFKSCVLPGDSAINKKLIAIFADASIENIKCVTKSLVLGEDILNILKNNNINIKEINCRFLIAPKYKAIEDFEQSLKNRPLSFGFIITSLFDRILHRNSKYVKYINFVNGYNSRESKLISYLNQGVEVKEGYFGSVIFVITENRIHEKKLLFSIRDKGPMMKRVGLYTEEPYIISIFNNSFDVKWNNENDKFNVCSEEFMAFITELLEKYSNQS